MDHEMNLIDAINKAKEYEFQQILSTSNQIGSIYLTDEFRSINDIFDENENNKTVFFYKDEDLRLVYNTNHHNYIKKLIDCRWNKYDDLKYFIDVRKQRANYGDLIKQQTLIDESVRKGYDLKFDGDFTMNDETIENLENIFKNTTGVTNITIKAYKMNIYEKGDFFTEHKDTPEKDLFATMIVHLEGDYDCMIINNIKWTKDLGNVAIFYTDVVHEIKPVPNYRRTVSLKVFLNNQTTNLSVVENKTYSNETLKLLKRINPKTMYDNSFCVLLQNGYSYFDLNDTNKNIATKLKGADRLLLNSLDELQLKYKFIPVIVKVEEYCDSYYIDKTNNDSTTDLSLDRRSTDHEIIDDAGEGDYGFEFNYGDESYKLRINIYNISNELRQNFSHGEIDWDKIRTYYNSNIYYLNKGSFVADKTYLGLHTGNDYGGAIVENIYINVLLCVENNQTYVKQSNSSSTINNQIYVEQNDVEITNNLNSSINTSEEDENKQDTLTEIKQELQQINEKYSQILEKLNKLN